MTAPVDLVIVGGGLGGSALGFAMAKMGARVTVLERETVYRDRVRGEGISPWGCAEARQLGIHDALALSVGLSVPSFTLYGADGTVTVRDMPSTSPSGLGFLNFRHHHMQEALATLAAEAGVRFLRGAEVTAIVAGPKPSVTYRTRAGTESLTARLVVGADGRASRARELGGFTVHRDPAFLVTASTLHRNPRVPPNSIHVARHAELGRSLLMYPIGHDMARSYLIHRRDDLPRKFSGPRDAQAFIAACRATNAPEGWYDAVAQDGPLASFEGASSWVDHPYRDGIALIGDAAGSSDPAFGLGLSLTLRDVRVLRDHLLAETDWTRAGERYATAHDTYFAAMKRILDWRTVIAYGTGPEADALRARAMPLHLSEPDRVPDLHGVGPDWPSDEHARQRYFGLA